jgi:hypothetical protein
MVTVLEDHGLRRSYRHYSLDIRLSGASRGSVNVTGTITAQVSGASKLTYAGTPQFAKRDTSGGYSIQAA